MCLIRTRFLSYSKSLPSSFGVQSACMLYGLNKKALWQTKFCFQTDISIAFCERFEKRGGFKWCDKNCSTTNRLFPNFNCKAPNCFNFGQTYQQSSILSIHYISLRLRHFFDIVLAKKSWKSSFSLAFRKFLGFLNTFFATQLPSLLQFYSTKEQKSIQTDIQIWFRWRSFPVGFFCSQNSKIVLLKKFPQPSVVCTGCSSGKNSLFALVPEKVTNH